MVALLTVGVRTPNPSVGRPPARAHDSAWAPQTTFGQCLWSRRKYASRSNEGGPQQGVADSDEAGRGHRLAHWVRAVGAGERADQGPDRGNDVGAVHLPPQRTHPGAPAARAASAGRR